VPKKRQRRARTSPLRSPWALVIVLALAVLAGWLLLVPHGRKHRPHPVAAVTQSPVEPVATAPATEEPAAAPATKPPMAAKSSPAATPSATPVQATSPSASPLATTPAATAAPAAAQGGARLALIVDDCGQWLDTERGFIALGIPLTLSVLPDVRYTHLIANEAAAAGKGVMLHLPMETMSGMNPGPGKVTTEMTDAQIVAQVSDDLDQIPLARGVNNHEGSKGSSDPRVMNDVIGVLAKRGNLFFIDSRTSPSSVGEQVAREHGVATASRDVFLDNQENVAYSEAQLREAAAIALRHGSAIAIGHPRPTTLEAVRALIPALQAQGITFVLAEQLTQH
jgi:polysaccharide deacetylase 2 family uncharacterized protein YibQ